MLRSLMRAILSLVLAGWAALGPGVSIPWPATATATATGGQMLVPRPTGLVLLDPAGGSEQPIYSSTDVVLGASWSPDGSAMAFSRFGKAPGDRYGGADLYLMRDGQASPILTHTSDDLLDSPVWLPDGSGLVYDVAALNGSRIEEVAADGSGRRVIEGQGSTPAVSPDGSLLAFVRSTRVDVLLARPLAGGVAREVVPGGVFAGIAWPRFSPDGQRLAFAAVGGPSSGPARPADGLGWLGLGPSAASAHGLPWDPWVVNVDGSGLRRLAELYEDDPTVAWSPDGTEVAMLGGGGLWLISADGGGGPRQLSYGSYGALDWRP